MKRVILLTALMLSAVSLFGCGSNTPESTIPTLDQTVKSRNGDKVLFFEGEDEETINPSMDNFNNVWFKIENGELFVALEDDGIYYRTTMTSVDGNRILYKISLYSEGYAPFSKEDLEKGFGKLTKAK